MGSIRVSCWNTDRAPPPEMQSPCPHAGFSFPPAAFRRVAGRCLALVVRHVVLGWERSSRSSRPGRLCLFHPGSWPASGFSHEIFEILSDPASEFSPRSTPGPTSALRGKVDCVGVLGRTAEAPAPPPRPRKGSDERGSAGSCSLPHLPGNAGESAGLRSPHPSALGGWDACCPLRSHVAQEGGVQVRPWELWAVLLPSPDPGL